VAAVGDQVTSVRVGQQVVATMSAGSHAELAVVGERSAFVVPDDMDPRVAAGIPVEFGTADDCLFEFGRLRAGDILSLGSFTAPMPPKPGMKVTVTYEGLPGNPTVSVHFK
jgi:NADPH:quinone reductase-like Zn-dependent oxidoreductase